MAVNGKRWRVEAPWALAPGDLEARLDTGPAGLSSDEAADRIRTVGPNALPEPEPEPLLKLVLNQFRSPLIYILLIAAVVSLALGELTDAIVIAAVLVLNAAIGFVQEYRARQAMEALQQLARARSRVVRDGLEREVDATELVPGDLVVLESGTKVPADARLVYAAAVETDESLLTGESMPVSKRLGPLLPDTPLADRICMLFMGTTLTRGHARALVTGTGLNSELGKISHEVSQISDVVTPLQRRMARFARLIGAFVLAAAGVGVAVGLAVGEPAGELFLAAVALAVSAIPEGLPVVLTITLAISVSRMARQRAVVRHISAVETLGSCSAIGSDKTGTLTENRMTVQRILAAGLAYEVTGIGYAREGRLVRDGRPLDHPDLAVCDALRAAVLSSDAEISWGERVHVSGDPTEIALLVAAAKLGLHKPALANDHPRLTEVPFEPERRYSASLNEDGDRALLSVKGAPEAIVPMCRSLDAAEVLAEAERMALDGLRVLAVAGGDWRASEAELLAGPPAGLTFLGLIGMIDPPRAEAIEAVDRCQEAGIRVVMITGDHASTAQAIAGRIGIRGADQGAITGAQLDELDDDELLQRLGQISVFARVSPQHKLRLVRGLQALGHAVAVTGDGVNDAPALKAADVGAAMGRSGTDVAREAADIIITDDNFASIAAAVEQGRIAFDNVRKTTFYLVSSGAAEVLAVLSSIFFRFPLPFLPAQLLWLNLVTNGIQDVALAFEPGERDVLKRPPRRLREGVLSGLLWERTALVGVVMAVGTVALYLVELDAGASQERARSVALTTMVLYQVFHVGNARSDTRSAFSISPISNRFLLVGTTIALALHVVALYLPPTQFLLRVEALDLATWGRMAIVAFSVIVAVEIHKIVRRSAEP